MIFLSLPHLQTPVVEVEDWGGLDVTLNSPVFKVELSADGRWARVAGERGTAIFDVRTGMPSRRWGIRFVPHLNVCNTFDERGVGAFTMEDSHESRALSFPNLSKPPVEGESRSRGSASYSERTRSWLVSRVDYAPNPGPVEFYDGKGRRVARMEGYPLGAAALSRDGRRAVAYVVDPAGHGRFVDLKTRRTIRAYDLPPGDRRASVEVSNDGKRAVLLTGDYTGWLVNLDDKRPGRPYRGISWHAFAPDLRRAVIYGGGFQDSNFPLGYRAWVKDLEPAQGSADGLGVGRLLRNPAATAKMGPIYEANGQPARVGRSEASPEDARVSKGYLRQGFDLVDKRERWPPLRRTNPQIELSSAHEFTLDPGEYLFDIRTEHRGVRTSPDLYAMSGSPPVGTLIAVEPRATDDGAGVVFSLRVEARTTYRILVGVAIHDLYAVRAYRRRTTR